jgi:hypothetical protein
MIGSKTEKAKNTMMTSTLPEIIAENEHASRPGTPSVKNYPAFWV